MDLPGIEQHHASSNGREDVVDFKRLDRRAFGKDRFDRRAQLRNVPLSFAEFMKLAAERILWGDRESVAKGAVRKPDRQVGIDHEQSFTDRLHEIQWVDFPHNS